MELNDPFDNERGLAKESPYDDPSNIRAAFKKSTKRPAAKAKTTPSSVVDELDEFEAAEKAAAINEPLPTVDELDEFESSMAAPTVDRSSYSTTTATNRSQALQENKREQLGKLHSDLLPESIGYGSARGLTLGMVDRAVQAGTTIGETMGATTPLFGGKTAPANPMAGPEARAEYLRGEDAATQAHPVAHLGASLATGVVPGIGLGSVGQKLLGTGLAGRLAPSTIQGGLAGAFNTRSDSPWDMAKGAALGAGMGAGTELTLGTAMNKLLGGAPKRKEDSVIRDVMESEAGRANLRTAGFQIARDIDDVRSVLKEYPDVAKAARLPATEFLPVVRERVNQAYKGQPQRYASVDKVLDESGQEMTAYRLLNRLVEAEKGLPTKDRVAVQAILQDMRDDLRKSHFPEWIGKPTYSGESLTIPTETLREWVTAAQDGAARTMGKINGTATYKVPEAAARIANDILEEQLDKAAVKGFGPTVAAIRESDRKVSALLSLSAAAKDRGQKEALQGIGLSARLGAEHRKQELAAAAGLAATGHLGASAALVAAQPARAALGRAGRWVNDEILAPLQEAAAGGNLKAQLGQSFLNRGAPQSAAVQTLDAVRGREPYAPPPLPPVVPGPPGTPESDWRAGTATR